jgi:hypothetical protein
MRNSVDVLSEEDLGFAQEDLTNPINNKRKLILTIQLYLKPSIVNSIKKII